VNVVGNLTVTGTYPATNTAKIQLQDQKANTVNGGAAVTGAWTARVLNTEVIDTGGDCTLAANQFTLAAGTYYIDAISTLFRVTDARIRLYNVTDATAEIIGLSAYCDDSDGDNVALNLRGWFTLAGVKTFELQYWAANGAGTEALGRSSDTGSIEIYTDIILQKQ
jgi:hypothetical protein